MSLDESHLFKSGPSADPDKANKIKSPRRWAVTATPMTNSARDLTKQLAFVRGLSKFDIVNVADRALDNAISSFDTRPSQSTFNGLLELLQPLMIMHRKSQQINGAEALSLPPSTTSTIMLTMSRDEDLAFNHIHSKRTLFLKHVQTGARMLTAQKCLLPQTAKVLKNGVPKSLIKSTLKGTLVQTVERKYIPERLTKIVALRNDLAQHQANEPNLRAVVFTQFVDIHDACVRGLKSDGFNVYQFTGSTSSLKRDKAIREFQDTATQGPAVFVVTLRSGSVGMTLTAASRVYLMEPCIDPATEIQAAGKCVTLFIQLIFSAVGTYYMLYFLSFAGRIHRLGQNKPCTVVKFAFRDSAEANIIALHKKIAAGKISIFDGFIPPEAMKILAKGLRYETSSDLGLTE